MSLTSVVINRRGAFLIAVWLLLSPRLAWSAYPQNPLLFDAAVYASQQGVYKFDPSRAAPLWSSLVGVETFAPVPFENLLLVGSTQGLYALDIGNGEVRWRIENSRTIYSPAIDRQAFAGSEHGELYALDPRTGEIRWQRQFDGWIYSPVLASDADLAWSGGQAHRVSAVSMRDGSLRHSIASSQEAVFSPTDLGDGAAAFNLFDGSTLIVDTQSGEIEDSISGQSQPTGLRRDAGTIYRSHRDGSLAAFSRDGRKLQWGQDIVPRDLALHPSLPGYLLLGDRDQNLLLLDLAGNHRSCRIEPGRGWKLPAQLEPDRILYFQKTMQPPGLSLVQTIAHCK